jgi:nitrate/nitrite-specific signal transduction histidine kinase
MEPTPDHETHEALDAATRAIAGLASVDEVLQVIVDEVRPLVAARYAALGIVNDRGLISRFFTSGIDDLTRARIGAPPSGHGFLGLIIRENRPIRIPDIATDDRRYGFPPNHPPMHSFLGVPVAVQGRSVGNMYLTDKDDGQGFSSDDQALVEIFARHAGIAIENARLHEQVQRLAVIDERERISQDLHDGIIQSLYAVGLSLEDVPELLEESPQEVAFRIERAIESLTLAIRDIRNFIYGLRPELLSGTSLLAGLAAITEEFRHNSMIDIELQADDPVGETTSDATAHLLGIVNEALSNVVRHSGASRALVLVSGERSRLRVSVTDNGTGFVTSDRDRFGHQGMSNMRARAASIHATIEIDSGSEGTIVSVVLPYDVTMGASENEGT